MSGVPECQNLGGVKPVWSEWWVQSAAPLRLPSIEEKNPQICHKILICSGGPGYGGKRGRQESLELFLQLQGEAQKSYVK